MVLRILAVLMIDWWNYTVSTRFNVFTRFVSVFHPSSVQLEALFSRMYLLQIKNLSHALIQKCMLKWHKNFCLYTYNFIKNKIFSYCRGVWVGSDELTRKIRAKFFFRSSFCMNIDQHEIVDRKLPNLIVPNFF